MREIEVKLKAKSFQEIEQKLKDKDCVLSEPISQHDTIYSLKSSKEVREELFKELESLGLSRTDEETRGYDTQIYQLGK